MKDQNIIFFDGQCQLCDRFINYVFKRDFKKQFFYAPLQGQTAIQNLKKEDRESLKSIIFLRQGAILKEAPAIRAIMKQLYPRWSLLFFVAPTAFFNFFYRWIAKKRYTLFGKKNELYSASEEQKKYFLP